MKTFSVFCILYVTILVNLAITAPIEKSKKQRYMLIGDEKNNIYVLDLEEEVPNVKVGDTEVTFHYRSRKTNSLAFTVNDVAQIKNTDFNPNRKTIFVIHGWNNDKSSDVNTRISAAFLKVTDCNVFVVDWSGPANSIYTTAKGAIPEVGRLVGLFIERLGTITGLSLTNINIAGHSLGAHVAGRAGAVLSGKVATIVGMDPAYPLFSYDKTDERLDPSDAKFVHIIHTSGGYLGFDKPLGHSDYYPNGGVSQNGCGVDLVHTCAHSRSYIYYAESIVTKKFDARLCNSHKDYEAGKCNNNRKSQMGGLTLDLSAKGDYYLNTNDKEPFALG